MIIAQVLLVLALCVLFAMRNSLAGAKPLMGVLAVLAVGLLMARPFLGGAKSDYTGDFEAAAGYLLAQALAEQVPEGGRMLLVQFHTSMQHIERVSAAQRRGVEDALRAGSWDIVTAGPDFVVDPTHGFDTEGALSPGDLAAAIEAHPDVDAVISFLGLPAQPPGIPLPPCTVLLAPAQSGVPSWAEESVRGAVTYKSGFDPREAAPRGADPQSVFDLRFAWVD